MALGVKEQGLVTGSYFFIGAFVVMAIILGEYVACVTKDRSQSGANRK